MDDVVAKRQATAEIKSVVRQIATASARLRAVGITYGVAELSAAGRTLALVAEELDPDEHARGGDAGRGAMDNLRRAKERQRAR